MVFAVCLGGISIASNEADGNKGEVSVSKDSGKAGGSEPNIPDDEKTVELGEIVVTASRTAKSPHDEPSTVNIVTRNDLDERMIRTVPDALKYTPGIMVQKTAYGHGSPYIRGFTSFRNLFLIDGIRLNNSAFRSGPNQYWNTVDPFTISQMEIVKGPSSVLFGSDAVGGTVNVRTLSPFDLTSEPVGGRMYYRYSSAENSNIGRFEGYGILPNGNG